MIPKIFLNDNEDSHYPLSAPGSVYPDGLISNINIIADTMDVYVYSVVCTDYAVSIVFVTKDGDKTIPLGHARWDMSGVAIATIIEEASENNIGWVSFGALAKDGKSYIGLSKIDDSCIHIYDVNRVLPVTLDILVSGDLDYDGTRIIAPTHLGGILLDDDSEDLDGGLLTINGKRPYTDGSAIIDADIRLPAGFIITKDTISPRVSVISIKYDEESDVDRSPFTCPDSDILKETILYKANNLSKHETPLDSFIEWYSKGKGYTVDE